jgi:hypothetical protein
MAIQYLGMMVFGVKPALSLNREKSEVIKIYDIINLSFPSIGDDNCYISLIKPVC